MCVRTDNIVHPFCFLSREKKKRVSVCSPACAIVWSSGEIRSDADGFGQRGGAPSSPDRADLVAVLPAGAYYAGTMEGSLLYMLPLMIILSSFSQYRFCMYVLFSFFFGSVFCSLAYFVFPESEK